MSAAAAVAVAATPSTPVQRFQQRPQTVQEYKDARQRYLDACHAVQAARVSLQKFQSKGSLLPRSIKLDISRSLSFPTIADQPDFFADFKATIAKAEDEIRLLVAAQMKAALEKHVTFLEEKAQPARFIVTERDRHAAFVRTFAVQYNELVGAAPAKAPAPASASAAAASSAAPASNVLSSAQDKAFPEAQALAEFVIYIREIIEQRVIDQASQQVDAIATELARKKLENEKLEELFAGGQNGTTINAIVESKVAPIRKQVAQLTSGSKRKDHPSSARTSSSVPTSHHEATSSPTGAAYTGPLAYLDELHRAFKRPRGPASSSRPSPSPASDDEEQPFRRGGAPRNTQRAQQSHQQARGPGRGGDSRRQ